MSNNLFAAIVLIAAAQARAQGITITAAKNELGAAMKGIKAPKPIKGIGPLDEYGAHTIDGYPPEIRWFTLAGLKLARTPQQIGNICAQVGCTPDGVLVPAGPQPVGWAPGQTANTFIVPLKELVGFDAHGAAQWRDVDFTSGKPVLYRRIRIRAESLADIQTAIATVKL